MRNHENPGGIQSDTDRLHTGVSLENVRGKTMLKKRASLFIDVPLRPPLQAESQRLTLNHFIIRFQPFEVRRFYLFVFCHRLPEFSKSILEGFKGLSSPQRLGAKRDFKGSRVSFSVARRDCLLPSVGGRGVEFEV